MLTGQNVLLTGGGSPIGQGLVPRILEQDPAVLRVFDSTESNLEDVMDRFDDDRLRLCWGGFEMWNDWSVRWKTSMS